MADLSDTIKTNAAQPKKVVVDGQVVEQHSLPDQIAADRHTSTAAAVAKSRITVRAAGVSWIQIRDNAANELLVMKLLQRGQSYDVPNQKDLSMGTGNAGVLVITVDGVEVPAVGPVGAVRRNILLDVDRLRNGTAVIK